MQIHVRPIGKQGFGLVEIMLMLVILTFGLLATGQLLYVAAGSSSLARSKETASLAAQSVLESLSALFGQYPSAADLTLGIHGPLEVVVDNPVDGAVLNRYAVYWTVEAVPDPRPEKALDARRLRATVRPVRMGGMENVRLGLNKVLSISTVISPKTRR